MTDEVVNALKSQAQMAINHNRPLSEIAPLLQQLHELVPADPLVVYRLGIAFARMEQFSTAEDYLRRSLALADTPLTRQSLAEACIDQGKFNDALEQIEILVAQNPIDPTNVNLKILCLQKFGKADEAVKAARDYKVNAAKAAEDQADNNSFWQSVASGHRTVVAGVSMSSKEAISFAHYQANRTTEESHRTYYLGTFYRNLEYLNLAESYLRDALESTPEESMSDRLEIKEELAIALMEQQRFEEALEQIEPVLIVMPVNERAAQTKFECLMHLGREQEAQETEKAYRRAISDLGDGTDPTGYQ